MKFLKADLLLVLLSASSLATAVTTLGPFSGGDGAIFDLTPGSATLSNDTYRWLGSVTSNGTFFHTYNFTLGLNNGGGVGGTPLDFEIVFSNPLVPFNVNSKIENFSFSLFGSSPATLIASKPADTNNLSFASLTTGNYSLVATGKAMGNANDLYGMSMVVTPVPEPEQWAMIIVGLFLVAMQVSKTKRTAEPLGLIEV